MRTVSQTGLYHANEVQVAMFEAHSDLEIFRIRLGKALDYEFHEDYIGGYFSEKGPRDVSSDFGVRLSCRTDRRPSPGGMLMCHEWPWNLKGHMRVARNSTFSITPWLTDTPRP